jgi:hypothetical protein
MHIIHTDCLVCDFYNHGGFYCRLRCWYSINDICVEQIDNLTTLYGLCWNKISPLMNNVFSFKDRHMSFPVACKMSKKIPWYTIYWYRISHVLWYDFYPTSCVFSIPEPWPGDRNHTSWIKIISHHKTWSLDFYLSHIYHQHTYMYFVYFILWIGIYNMWYQKFITWVISHWYQGKYVIKSNY